jgi:glucose-1-phosphate thymidylyltransferase
METTSKKIKGIILAGGKGTRLAPMTRIINKHLLPVYHQPMILYPLATLKNSGIEDIMIVCGREFAGDFMNFLGSGKEHGVRLSYAIQDSSDGIAGALRQAEPFADGGKIAVILGDNIFTNDFSRAVKKFEKENGAKLFLKQVKNAQRFGVPEFQNGKIIHIEEKPVKPKSNYAVTGFYLYDNKIFDIVKNLQPSKRGELEVTDAHNVYLQRGLVSHEFIKDLWSDAGTIASLLRTSLAMSRLHGKPEHER